MTESITDESLSDLEKSNIISNIEKSTVRNYMLDEGKRIDGRAFNEVRPISIQTNTLPRAHGDSLFTRGQTQAYVVMTLGSERDAQSVDHIIGEDKQRFMLHYNFPPYCVGEVGMLLAPKRREIGHGPWLVEHLSLLFLANLNFHTSFAWFQKLLSPMGQAQWLQSVAARWP